MRRPFIPFLQALPCVGLIACSPDMQRDQGQASCDDAQACSAQASGDAGDWWPEDDAGPDMSPLSEGGSGEGPDAQLGTPDTDPDASTLDATAEPPTDAMQSSADGWVGPTVDPDAQAPQTPSGRVSLLRDIETDTYSAFPRLFTRVGNTVYFVADHAYDRADIFRTDGENVHRVAGGADVRAPWSAPTALGALAGKLVFAAPAKAAPAQVALWSSDGTLAGSQQVIGSLPGTVTDMASSGALLFFMVEPAGSASLRQLWRTDGTGAGTLMLAQVGLSGSQYPPAFTSAAGFIFFVVDTGGTRRLWRSDGTAAGTISLAPTQIARPASLAVVGDRLFTVGQVAAVPGGPSAPRLLLTSDGSVEGTRSAFASSAVYPSSVAAAGGSLYVTGSSTEQGYATELWISAGGTTPLTKVAVELTAAPSASATHAYLPTLAGILQHDPATGEMPLIHAFSAELGFGYEIRVASQGAYILHRRPPEDATLHFASRAGSQRLHDHFRASSVSVHGDILYAAVFTPEHGEEPWVSRGTGASTRKLADVHAGTQSSGPGAFVGVGDAGLVLFPAKTRALGSEPWVSEGSTASTHLLQDVGPGVGDGFKAHAGRIGDFAFFIHTDGTRTYRVDRAGSMQVVGRGVPAGQPGLMFAGSRVHIHGWDQVYTAPLEDLTGTTATLVNAMPLGRSSRYEAAAVIQRGNADYVLLSPPGGFTTVGGTSATLYRWSASERYPQQIVGVSFDYPSARMARLGDDIYYRAGGQLWRLDANDHSVVLTQFPEGGVLRTIFETTFRGALYFLAFPTADSGPLLYATQGGAPLEMGGARPSGIAPAGDRLVLCQSDSVWSTDGNPATTRQLASLHLPRPSECVSHAGIAYFAADDGRHGVELWRSDGTPEGTYMESDIASGPYISNPGELTSAGGALYFRADHPLYGREPWVLR